MISTPYGFRIVGSCSNQRRLVDADKAMSAYAACDPVAEINSEAYLSAFQFGSDFSRHLDSTRSTRGYSGPCGAPYIWWDIDAQDNLDAATGAARQLTRTLTERYQIGGNNLLIFFSGSKGYHVGLPTSLWYPEATIDFNKQARKFAELIANLETINIDTGVYDKVRAFRAPNSRHPKSGLYKRFLKYQELFELDAKAIVQLARKPAPFKLPEPPDANDLAIADWDCAGDQVLGDEVMREARQMAQGGLATLNRATLEFIQEGAEEGERHRLLYSAAANLAEFGCSSELAHALLTEPALDSGLPPSEVKRTIDCGIKPKGGQL